MSIGFTDVVWSKDVDAVLGVGQPLAELGVRNWALTKFQALDALDKLSAVDIAVLGGDVYEFENGALRSTTDSWYCDRKQDESAIEFCRRSAIVARSYITRYREIDDLGLHFALVPQT